MKRHVIYGRYGLSDNFNVKTTDDEITTTLELLNSEGELNYGMHHALVNLSKMGIFPTETAIDLLVLASHVQAADILIPREMESQDSWTREIRLIVPVNNVELWNRSLVTLTRILNFLTGDLWTIGFRQRINNISSIAPIGTPNLIGTFDKVSLFSGGLDSLIGAINLLESGKKPLFISHASEGSVSKAQQTCFQALKNRYSKNYFDRLRVWMSFPGIKISNYEHEKTTRGRSFLFFTLGVVAGSGFKKEFVLDVPENGLIALNIPLDQLRLGSHSTRTTHPFYIARWNELLRILGIMVHIQNPYWNLTKGEMVNRCSNKPFLKRLLTSSLSCSSPDKFRYRGFKTQHCGYCIPCLIRRAAIENGFGTDKDPTTYVISNLKTRVLNTLSAEGQQIRSFKLAINRLRSNPNLAKVIILSAGSLSDESKEDIQVLADMYRRGLEEVASIIENVRTKSV